MPTRFLLGDLEGKEIDIESDEHIRELSSLYESESTSIKLSTNKSWLSAPIVKTWVKRLLIYGSASRWTIGSGEF